MHCRVLVAPALGAVASARRRRRVQAAAVGPSSCRTATCQVGACCPAACCAHSGCAASAAPCASSCGTAAQEVVIPTPAAGLPVDALFVGLKLLFLCRRVYMCCCERRYFGRPVVLKGVSHLRYVHSALTRAMATLTAVAAVAWGVGSARGRAEVDARSCLVVDQSARCGVGLRARL